MYSRQDFVGWVNKTSPLKFLRNLLFVCLVTYKISRFFSFFQLFLRSVFGAIFFAISIPHFQPFFTVLGHFFSVCSFFFIFSRFFAFFTFSAKKQKSETPSATLVPFYRANSKFCKKCPHNVAIVKLLGKRLYNFLLHEQEGALFFVTGTLLQNLGFLSLKPRICFLSKKRVSSRVRSMRSAHEALDQTLLF